MPERFSPNAISGYELVSRVLHKTRGQTESLINLAEGRETYWLEFKAAMTTRHQERKEQENDADGYWNVAKAVIAMANSEGGVVLVGIAEDERGHPVAVGLNPSDPRQRLGQGLERFLRTEIFDRINQGEWRTGRDNHWRIQGGWPPNQFEVVMARYKREEIAAILVKPVPTGGRLLIVRNVTTSADRVPIRVPGDVAQVRLLTQFEEFVSHTQNRSDRSEALYALWSGFWKNTGETSSPSPLDFSGLVQVKSECFVGREWLFNQISKWNPHRNERALLIIGDPGAGKSSVMAYLARTNPDCQVLGYHFCQANETSTLSPGKFVQSLAAMIASRVPAYAEQFEEPPIREALTDKSCESDPGGAFLRGILQPLHKVPPPEDGVRYILVDALDEALSHTGPTNIVDVLAGRIERLPQWLRVLATTRDAPTVRQRLSGLRAIRIDTTDECNLRDLELFISRRLDEPVLAKCREASRTTVENAIEQISGASSGNFLYAFHALDGIAKGFYSFTELKSLPRGLEGIYADFLGRIFEHGAADGADWRRTIPLLQILCAAEEPLSRAELAAASGLDAGEDLPELLRRLAQILSRRTRGNGEEAITFYHKSIADWLISKPDEKDFYAAPEQGRALLAHFCRTALAENRSTPGWYVRRHAVGHFLQADDLVAAVHALSDLEFIEARAVAQELPAMLRDYSEAVNRLPEGEAERETERRRKDDLDRYAQEMKAYVPALDIDGTLTGRPRPREFVRLWSNEEIETERRRIINQPNRLDIVRAFQIFVASHVAPLHAHATQIGFVANLARNDAPAGPVHEAGKSLLGPLKCVKLIRRFAPTAEYNPLKACEAILESECFGPSLGLVLSPDAQRFFSGDWSGNILASKIPQKTRDQILKVEAAADHFAKPITLSGDGRVLITEVSRFDRTEWIPGRGWVVKPRDPVPDVRTKEVPRVQVWNVETGARIACLDVPHMVWPGCLEVSHNGGRIVSVDQDGGLHLWEILNGKCAGPTLISRKARSGKVTALKLSADGKCILTGHQNGELSIIHTDTGESRMLDSRDGPVTALALSADERYMLSVHSCGVMIWNITAGNPSPNPILCRHDEVTSISVSAGEYFVSAGFDYKLRVWNFRGDCLRVLEGHHEPIESVEFSPNAAVVYSKSFDGEIRAWNIEKAYCLETSFRAGNHVCGFAQSTDGKRIISETWAPRLTVWDTESGDEIKNLKIENLAFKSDRHGFKIFYLESGILKTFDVQTGESTDFFNADTNQTLLESFAFSPCGRRVALAYQNGSLGLRDPQGREYFRSPNQLQLGRVWHLLFSPDQKHIVSVDDKWRFGVWDLDDPEDMRIYDLDAGSMDLDHKLILSADGRRLISLRGSRVSLFNIAGTDLSLDRRINLMRKEEIASICLTGDGEYLFTGGRLQGGSDHTVHLFHIGSERTEALFHISGISQLALSPNNKRLVAGFSDGRVELFDIENLLLGPIPTTAHREIHSEDEPPPETGTTRTACCGQDIEVPSEIVARIEDWSVQNSSGGYSDQNLLLDCPRCGTQLRLNPFIVSIPAF